LEAVPASRSAHQRIDGEARVSFGPNGMRDLYQRAPCRLLFPQVEAGNFPQAVAVTTSGGLTGGDRIRYALDVAENSTGTLTTQAAEKLYRVLPADPDIHIETRIDVRSEGRAEWLAQEAILFDRTRVRRQVAMHIAQSGRLLATESLVFGRGAMGERFCTGLVHDAWRIWRGGRLVWADAFHIDGDFAAQAALPFGLGSATAMATILYVGPDAADHLPLARDLAGDGTGGATSFDGLLILRLIDREPRLLRDRVMRAASMLRVSTLGLPPTLPAVWTC
jgi:urease accessory protein